jgi:hypothetical protein
VFVLLHYTALPLASALPMFFELHPKMGEKKSYKFDKEREDPFRARLRFLWRTRHKLIMRTKPAKRNAHSSIT